MILRPYTHIAPLFLLFSHSFHFATTLLSLDLPGLHGLSNLLCTCQYYSAEASSPTITDAKRSKANNTNTDPKKTIEKQNMQDKNK